MSSVQYKKWNVATVTSLIKKRDNTFNSIKFKQYMYYNVKWYISFDPSTFTTSDKLYNTGIKKKKDPHASLILLII